MENPREKFYENYKDKNTVNKILCEIKKYDVYDIIAKLSALSLIPENQNKALFIDPIIAAILTLSHDDLNSNYIISMGKFKQIVHAIEEMDIRSLLDPPENIFIDRVMFYENYNIYTGINYIPGYILQEFINAIYLYNNFSVNFTDKTSKLIKFILEISDYISEKTGIKLCDIKKFNEIANIIVPDSNKLEKLKEIIIIKEQKIREMLQNDEELIELLYSEFKNEDIEKILCSYAQTFFNKPFLKDNNGNVIILSPSVLIPFLINRIICIADGYGEKERLIEVYNNTVWKECMRYFNKLGNNKINEKALKIELKCDTKFLKEVLLNGDNRQLILVIGLFDDGIDYNEEKLFDNYNNAKIEKVLHERMIYIKEKLKENNINEKDIFVCLIYNSYGRSMIVKFNDSVSYKAICLNPFELKCISINEREQKFFLTRYIMSKNKLSSLPQFFGELPYIDMYTNCNYSFYVDDHFNPQNTRLYLSAGDCIEYIVKAIKKENRQLVQSYENGYMREVILQDEKRNIYTCDMINNKEVHISLLVKLKNIEVWIYSKAIKNETELNIYYCMIDMISYWIGECKEILESIDIKKKHVKIKLDLKGEAKEYFYDINYDGIIENTITIKQCKDEIVLDINPETYHCLSKSREDCEKNIMIIILNEVFHINNYYCKKVEEVFSPQEKRKFFTIDYENYPYLKPINYPKNRKISENDINELLDDIGKYILSLNRWSYGIINESDKNEITSLVVEYLYKILQQKISKINQINLIEIIYHDLEEKIYYMMLFPKRQHNELLCYPEKKSKVWKEFNEMQRVSMSMKFLIEYVSAQPPMGKEVLGEYEYEELLAICSLIIEWAYNNDLFRYKIFNSDIEILKSNRIGIRKDNFDIMQESMLNAMKIEFEYNSVGKWNEFLIKRKFESEELDIAFNIEMGFTFTEFLKVNYSLILIGEKQKSEIKKAKYEELIKELKNENEYIENDKLLKILKYISLEERDDFLKPPNGFRKEEIYPWRFNRELSFTRRPVIKRENEYIWGNRNVFHMTMFVLDLIDDGKFKSKSKEMNRYIGKISNERGKAFNDSIFNILDSFNDLVVDKNLKKINGKRICDDKNNDLGDIDIIYIHEQSKKIVVGEVKDFKFSKNPYEIYLEYIQMFEDTESKRSYSTKLERRTKWVENHIEDVKQQYNLTGEGWKVYKTFIVNKHLISKNVYKKNENIIAISELTINSLLNLNEL